MLDQIIKKIQNNPISYEGYLEYGKYLENVNLRQAYLSYENALFYVPIVYILYVWDFMKKKIMDLQVL